MSIDIYSLILVVTMALSVAALRFIPFVIFRGEKTPDFVNYLGKYLPYAIMGMMIIYCLKDTNLAGNWHGLPEFISIVILIIIQFKLKNSLVAIVSSTIVYICLVNYILI